MLLITAFPSIDTAVRGMKLGARDHIGKPFSPELRRAHGELTRRLAYGSMVGEPAAMRELRATIVEVAASDATVLITGESRSSSSPSCCARSRTARSSRSAARPRSASTRA